MTEDTQQVAMGAIFATQLTKLGEHVCKTLPPRYAAQAFLSAAIDVAKAEMTSEQVAAWLRAVALQTEGHGAALRAMLEAPTDVAN